MLYSVSCPPLCKSKGILNMTLKKTTSPSSNKEDGNEFTPQAGLRNSTLWKDGKPDPRLRTLMRLLARSAAQQFIDECEQKEQAENKDT